MLSDRLLDVAIDHFGRLGFEGASTRAIARASGTAMSSITYHFGSKEQLYIAAAEHIGKGIAQAQSAALKAALEAAEGSRSASIEALLALLDSMASMMLRRESEAWARFIMREQQTPTKAFDAIYESTMKGLSEAFVTLVRRVRSDLDDKEARATAILLIGQAMILRAGRASVCRVLGVQAIDDSTAELLRARLRANALCIVSEKQR